jgi:NADH-quinone oxidoreductase subunit F
MPLGTPLAKFVYEIGGGGVKDRAIKAAQTGGPSGGCIPHEMFDTPVDYETLAQIGSIMGSGGMVILDEDNCMVDIARYFIEFTHSESCGKCVPCRAGLDQALTILNGVTKGSGSAAELELLDDLGRMIRDTSLCGLGQTAPNPVLTTMRHFRHEFDDHIIAKRCRAGVCDSLAVSPCENSCPLHMNIPRFLDLLKQGRLEDAFESVILDNPLPCSTGRVCQHPCDDRCRRQTLDDAVNMREAHRFIADSFLLTERFDEMAARFAARKLPPTGRSVAVVGAGPAGLSAAFYLALLGHDVTVFEKNSEAGGMLRFAIPEYRLPKRVLEREIEWIRRLGVKFQFDCAVGSSVALAELDAKFDAAFISIGTWKESWVYLAGTELKGVIPALLFLEAVAKQDLTAIGKRVAIIGGGNAAVDSARTAIRMGLDATIVYRRERKEMPAIQEEVEAALAEGVKLMLLAAPHRILGDARGNVKALEIARTRLGEYDPSGRRKPVPTGEIIRLECDSVILAVGETVDLDFARASGLTLQESGTFVVDRFTLETSRPKFYAGGDVVTGASNVSNAMGLGKKAARKMDERLMGEKRFHKLFGGFDYGQEPPGEESESPRQRGRELVPMLRVKGDNEVVLTLSAEEAAEEAGRCLRCDIRG